MSLLYVLGTDPAFEKCLPDTLIEEGGYSNDARDPGGMTMEGIIQREYDKWRKGRGLPTQWVKYISPDELRTIYHDEYWLPHCPKLPAGLDLCLFDTNVNNGVHAGVVLLQRALSISSDGQWGAETGREVDEITPDETVSLIQRFYQLRGDYYKSLRNFHYFGKDWMRRDLDIEKWALAMVDKGMVA